MGIKTPFWCRNRPVFCAFCKKSCNLASDIQLADLTTFPVALVSNTQFTRIKPKFSPHPWQHPEHAKFQLIVCTIFYN